MKTSAFTFVAYTHQAALGSARRSRELMCFRACNTSRLYWIHPWLLAGRLNDLDGGKGIMDLGWLAWLNIEIVTVLEGPISFAEGREKKIEDLSKTIFRWDVSVKKIHFWRNIKFTKNISDCHFRKFWVMYENDWTSWNYSQKIQFLDCCICIFLSLFIIVSVSYPLWPACFFLCWHTGFIPLCLAVGFSGTCF